VEHLAPGEDITFVSPNRPNAAMDPFMRMMLREVAAGIGVSYESLSRDYSQSNYSSSRLALLDDRDLWRVLQQWFIRSFREPLHREWLRQAILSGAIPEISREEYMLNPEKFESVRFKPRGWSWIDPSSEVEAYKQAIRSGLTTTTDVIAMTGDGDDIEDKLERRARELQLKKEIGAKYGVDLSNDTDPDKLDDGSPAQPAEPQQPKEPPGSEAKEEVDDEPRSGGVFHIRR
jgi:lambda family phage portal protein